MKLVSPKLSLLIAGTALLFAGCTQKPTRPEPSQTLGQVVGPAGGTDTGNVTGIPGGIDPNAMPIRDGAGADGDRTRFEANTIYFEYDQSAIKPSERVKLKGIKDELAKDPTLHILLEGHCDWRGTAEYNLGLGDRRANAVKKYLLSLGVAADRLDTVSKGSLEAKPNADAATMIKDRRVDLVATKGGSGAMLPAAATAPATK